MALIAPPPPVVEFWDLVGPLDKDGKPTGPVKLERNVVLAKEAIRRDPNRYVVNLPKGQHPGPAEAHRLAEVEQRQRDLSDSFDVHFGRVGP